MAQKLKDRFTLYRRVLAEFGRRLRQSAGQFPSRRLRYWGRSPDSILVEIPDIRAIDLVAAEQIYSGVFSLSGRVLHTNGANVFELDPPSRKFAEDLHSFRWLRHLHAEGSGLSSANARSLIQDWQSSHGDDFNSLSWMPDIAARRLLSWLQHSALPLKGADLVFYRTYLKFIGLHIRYLRGQLPSISEGAVRLRCRIALTAAQLALPSSGAAFHNALRKLSDALDRQVHGDGGHLSRNSETMLDLLYDLVPLKLAMAKEGEQVPPAMMSAIDRLYAGFSFFRHTDGALALFNGVGANVPDQVSTIFRFDETKAATPDRLPHSGYERLASGGTIVIADTGQAADYDNAQTHFAGALSFEMSSGRHRYIVNSGVDRIGPDAYRQISRQTVAHSTLSLNETSSTRFIGAAKATRYLGRQMPLPPKNVTSQRVDEEGERGFIATHDGYISNFGVVHKRQLMLDKSGSTLRGRDVLFGADGNKLETTEKSFQAAVRFHLHPSIHVILNGNGDFMLMADGDDSWALQSECDEPKLIESFFFAQIGGATKTKAIVLSFDTSKTCEMNWALVRTGIASRL